MKIKKIIKKNFLKEKENFDTIIFEIVDIKNSNAEIFIKYYIDDTMTTSSNFTKFFFELENLLEKESATQTQAHEKKQRKKKFEKEQKRKLREDEREKDK